MIVVAIVLIALVALYGLLTQRNLLRLIVALDVLMKAAMLAFMEAGRVSGSLALTQSLAFTVIVVDTIVLVIALALAIQVRRRCGTLDVGQLTTLRR